MRLFITGASGFIGRSTVRAAIGRGHAAVALVRTPPPGSGVHPAAAATVVGDLCEAGTWAQHLAGCDAVVHLAGSTDSSEDATRAMVTGTQQLLEAMAGHSVDRMVLVSSISVYDYLALVPGDVVDETAPLESAPARREAYVQGKLAQEQLAAARPEVRTTVLRPGAVYGAGRLWAAGHALRLGGRVGVAIAPRARMKLTYVENCAEAIVRAAERDESAGSVVDVVDDDLPTQREYAAALARHGLDTTRTVPIPYRLAATTARTAWRIDHGLLRDRLALPGLLVPATLAARYKPLEYSNAAAKRLLGWSPRFALDEALARVASSPVAA